MKYFKKNIKRRVFRRKRVAKKPRVSLATKKYVKKVIHSTLENKERMNYAANASVMTSDVNSCTYPLIIGTTQSTQADGRIGNQIRITKGYYKGCINLLPYNSTTNPYPAPVWVKIWVVKDLKNQGQFTTMDATAYGNFFRSNNTGLGFQSTPLDVCLEVNKDYFRPLYSRTFKLGTAGHVSGSDNPSNNFDNSAFAKTFTINWGKWVKKQLKFNETSSNPTNDNLYIVYQAITAEGTNCAGKQLIEFHYSNYMHFEDA